MTCVYFGKAFFSWVKRCTETVDPAFFIYLFPWKKVLGWWHNFQAAGSPSMWANLSSYISQLPVRATHPSPLSNGAVITPLYNLTHRLSQPRNRGWVGDCGGRVALRVSFLKAGAELPGPLFVFVHFCTPHNVSSCYMLRGIQMEEMGNSISPQRISNLWRNPHLKENCQQLNSPLQWVWRKWATVWSGNEIMLIIRTESEKLNLRKMAPNFVADSVCLNFPPVLPLCHFIFLYFGDTHHDV